MRYRQIEIGDAELGLCPICREAPLTLWLDTNKKDLISVCGECGRECNFTLASLMKS
jgi:transcription elongation factor Elf1